jgi:hypothetical protein
MAQSMHIIRQRGKAITSAPEQSRAARAVLFTVRYLLPGALLVAGIVLVVGRSSDEALGLGVALAGAALSVFLLNVLMRAGIRDNAQRRREEEARRHFDRYGRWPPGDG